MESKERVLSAINHVRPDRVPINFRSVDVVKERMMKHYGLGYEELLDHLCVDFREIVPPYTGPGYIRDAWNQYVDEWGVKRRELITDRSRDVRITESPLAMAEQVGDIISHKWPSPDDYDFSVVPALCRRYEKYAICGPGIFAEGFHGAFHQLTYLFGMDEAMVRLITDEEIVESAIRKIMDYWLRFYDRLFSAGKGAIDLMFWKDDMGTQNSLLISPELYRKYFKKTLVELNELCDSYGVMMICHSCGSVLPLIPDFIDAGVRILDPIQTSARDMDIRVLKERFGDKLTFHGAIDTQQDLPRKTPEQIRELVKETIRTLGKNGGYLFSPSHRIQQDTPTENIIAMYDTARTFSDY